MVPESVRVPPPTFDNEPAPLIVPLAVIVAALLLVSIVPTPFSTMFRPVAKPLMKTRVPPLNVTLFATLPRFASAFHKSLPALIVTVCPAPPNVFVAVSVRLPVPLFAIVPVPLITPSN